MFITNRNRPWNHFLYSEDDGAGDGVQPPATDTAAAEPTQQEVDWAKRYSDLQPEYTRTTQKLSAAEEREEQYKALLFAEDQDTRREAAQALGIELADDEDNTQYDNPEDQRLSKAERELAELRQTVTGDLTARQEAEQIKALETAAESSMDALKVPADEELRDWLVSRAVALPPTDKGTLDIEQAWSQFGALMNGQKKSWAGTKNSGYAFTPGGGEGTPAPDLSTHQGRVQHMLTRLHTGDG